MSAPQGATLTGETVGRRPVYRERKPNYILRQKEIGGDLQWNRHPDGSKRSPIMERVQDPDNPWTEKEFVLVDLGNGIVQKNYHFRDTSEPEEVVPSEDQRRIDQLEQQLAQLSGLVQKEAIEFVEHEASVEPDEDDDLLLTDEDLGLREDDM